jgi:cytochrome b561
MIVQAELSTSSWRYAFSRKRALIIGCVCLSLFAVVIGVLGLAKDSWPRKVVDSWTNIHALFALLACGLALARYRWCVEYSPRRPPADFRELSRHLSRTVYWLLYVVIGVRQSVALIGCAWHGGALDFNVFDERFRHGPEGFDLKDDVQLFLASGFFALIFVRVIARLIWIRPSDKALTKR